jgi:hypothetical protein
MAGVNDGDVDRILRELLERLASIEHERGAHWQRYMHSKGKREPDGSLVLPVDLVRWERQIATPYGELTEAERESGRDQVRKYLPLIAEALKRANVQV